MDDGELASNEEELHDEIVHVQGVAEVEMEEVQVASTIDGQVE